MGWFRNKKTNSISRSYKDSHGFEKKWKYWESHLKDPYYDPSYDFRKFKKPTFKEKIKLWFKKKRVKEDEFEKGHDRVKDIINK